MKRKAGVTIYTPKADIDKDKFQDYLQNEIVESTKTKKCPVWQQELCVRPN